MDSGQTTSGFYSSPAQSRKIEDLTPLDFTQLGPRSWRASTGQTFDSVTGTSTGSFGRSADGAPEDHVIKMIRIKSVFDRTGQWTEGFNPQGMQTRSDAPQLPVGPQLGLPSGLSESNVAGLPEMPGPSGSPVLLPPPSSGVPLRNLPPFAQEPGIESPTEQATHVQVPVVEAPVIDAGVLKDVFDQFEQDRPDNKARRAIEAFKGLPDKPSFRDWLNHPVRSLEIMQERKKLTSEKEDAENYLAWLAHNPEQLPAFPKLAADPTPATAGGIPEFVLTDEDAGLVQTTEGTLGEAETIDEGITPEPQVVPISEAEQAFLEAADMREKLSIVPPLEPKVDAFGAGAAEEVGPEFDFFNDDDIMKVFAMALATGGGVSKDDGEPESIALDFYSYVSPNGQQSEEPLIREGVGYSELFHRWDPKTMGPVPGPGMAISVNGNPFKAPEIDQVPMSDLFR